jgi:NAD(P)-dependent dehydrogenase (short-subunit alcohol dehydrogenase family)
MSVSDTTSNDMIGHRISSALVVGASGGIGSSVAAALEAGGTDVTRLSRTADGLDVTDEKSVAEHLGRLDGPFDLVFVATGALVIDGYEPEKSLDALSGGGLLDQVRVNALGPVLVLKHARRLLPRDRRTVFAALSARVGSIGDNAIGGWYAYRTAKAALNQLLHTAAIELSRTHKKCVVALLHPGTVETPFTAEYAGRHRTVPADEAARNLLAVLDGLSPQDTGRFFDYAGDPVPW